MCVFVCGTTISVYVYELRASSLHAMRLVLSTYLYIYLYRLLLISRSSDVCGGEGPCCTLGWINSALQLVLYS